MFNRKQLIARDIVKKKMNRGGPTSPDEPGEFTDLMKESTDWQRAHEAEGFAQGGMAGRHKLERKISAEHARESDILAGEPYSYVGQDELAKPMNKGGPMSPDEPEPFTEAMMRAKHPPRFMAHGGHTEDPADYMRSLGDIQEEGEYYPNDVASPSEQHENKMFAAALRNRATIPLSAEDFNESGGQDELSPLTPELMAEIQKAKKKRRFGRAA